MDRGSQFEQVTALSSRLPACGLRLIATGTYTFDYGALPMPVISPGSGTYLSSVTVSMSSQAGSTIRYTLDGSEPTASSAPYTAAFPVSMGVTLKAKAFHVDYTTSTTRTEQYWTKVAAPSVTPAAGTLTAGTLIAAATVTPGATIHYTIDGREPTTADPYFSASAPLYVGEFTLKVRAFLPGAHRGPAARRHRGRVGLQRRQPAARGGLLLFVWDGLV